MSMHIGLPMLGMAFSLDDKPFPAEHVESCLASAVRSAKHAKPKGQCWAKAGTASVAKH